MKNLKVVLLAALAVTGLASCAKECETHTDKNHDGTCEVCGKTGLTVNHVDENPKDHKCDVCSKELSKCEDTNKDHKCDYCGAETSKCVDESPKDHKCDICGKELSTCVDNNHDSHCDICAKGGMDVHHKDENKDDKCDVCGCAIICESYELDVSGATLVFTKGSEFDSEGVKVIGTFTDETERELDFTTSSPDMTTVGTKEVTVSFLVNGVSKSETYEIEVVYWSQDDLSILNYSLIGYYGPCMPYIPGMKAGYTLDGEYLDDIYVELEDATMDDLLLYNELLTSINYADSSLGVQINWKVKPLSVSAKTAEAYGLVADTAFAANVVPYYTSKSGYSYRAFTQDEAYIGGLTEDGSLKVIIRSVDPWLEGAIGYPLDYWTYFDDSCLYSFDFSLLDDVFNGNKEDESLGGDFSECAAGVFVMPDYTGEEDYPLSVYNLKTTYPFAKSLDEYALAVELVVYDPQQADFDTYGTKLSDAGFVAGEPVNVGTAEAPSYVYPFTFDDEFAGKFEVEYSQIKTLQTTSGSIDYMTIDVYYTAPEYYYYKTEAYVVSEICEAYEVTPYENDNISSDVNTGNTTLTFTYSQDEAFDANGLATALYGPVNAIGQTIDGSPAWDSESRTLTFVTSNGSYDLAYTAVAAEDMKSAEVTVVCSKTVLIPGTATEIVASIAADLYGVAKEGTTYFVDSTTGIASLKPVEMKSTDPTEYADNVEWLVENYIPSYFEFVTKDTSGGTDYYWEMYVTTDGAFTMEITAYMDQQSSGTEDAIYISIEVYPTVSYSTVLGRFFAFYDVTPVYGENYGAISSTQIAGFFSISCETTATLQGLALAYYSATSQGLILVNHGASTLSDGTTPCYILILTNAAQNIQVQYVVSGDPTTGTVNVQVVITLL